MSALPLPTDDALEQELRQARAAARAARLYGKVVLVIDLADGHERAARVRTLKHVRLQKKRGR